MNRLTSFQAVSLSGTSLWTYSRSSQCVKHSLFIWLFARDASVSTLQIELTSAARRLLTGSDETDRVPGRHKPNDTEATDNQPRPGHNVAKDHQH